MAAATAASGAGDAGEPDRRQFVGAEIEICALLRPLDVGWQDKQQQHPLPSPGGPYAGQPARRQRRRQQRCRCERAYSKYCAKREINCYFRTKVSPTRLPSPRAFSSRPKTALGDKQAPSFSYFEPLASISTCTGQS